MTQVENLRLAGACERALTLSRGWDPRMRILARLLEGLRCGSLSVTLPSGQKFVRVGDEPGPEASVVVHRWRALRRLFTGGDIGFAQAWIDGDWSSLDLTALIRLAARNLHGLRGAGKGLSFSRLAFRLRHLLNDNTKRGSARNIIAHYDLGNDFFRLWLDEAMLYSSGLWDGSTPTLEAAQSRKIERILDLLDVRGGERILEIGCGWGTLAVRLAEAGAAHITGLTLSPAQLDFARDLAAARGSASQVDFRLQDYRDIDGRFDRIVSIEMAEAVGHHFLLPPQPIQTKQNKQNKQQKPKKPTTKKQPTTQNHKQPQKHTQKQKTQTKTTNQKKTHTTQPTHPTPHPPPPPPPQSQISAFSTSRCQGRRADP